MMRFVQAVLAIVLVGLIVLASMPAVIDPEPYTPGAARALERNESLRAAEVIATGAEIGPEDLMVEAGPRITTGMKGGAVLEWTPQGTQVLANTGGRPLGIARDAQGRVLVADADKGLLRLEGGKLVALATTCDGRPFRFTNELAVAKDGSVYFSDSSDTWSIRDFAFEVIEGRARGRILKVDPAGQVKTLVDRVNFPNGVALAPDESALYFAESTRYRVSKLHLTGPKTGQVEPLIENLPGFPDNLSVSPRGTLWVALFSLRDPLLDLVGPMAWARGLVAKLPRALWENPASYGCALEVDAAGNVVRSLQDPGGRVFGEVTAAVERDGWLWLGTLRASRFAKIKL